jgi:hypothetical protein
MATKHKLDDLSTEGPSNKVPKPAGVDDFHAALSLLDDPAHVEVCITFTF